MLKLGLPKDLVIIKLKEDGLTCVSYLDKGQEDLIPIDLDAPLEEDLIPVSEHPLYAKYFRMLKFQTPKDAIQAKMRSEGVNPSYLDKDPSALVSAKLFDDTRRSSPVPNAKEVKQTVNYLGCIYRHVRIHTNHSSLLQIRKKKLHWKALDPTKVSQDSLWADGDKDMDIQLDQDEFNRLFVES